MKSGKLGSQQMIHLDLHETIALTTLPLNEMLTLNKDWLIITFIKYYKTKK